VEDLLEEIVPALAQKVTIQQKALRALDPVEAKVLEAIGSEPVHVDQIIQQSGLDVASVLDALLKLELLSQIEQLPGKRFLAK
jgi:predicted Rossmann fold nucleotide-binding protein DprA/Smf involved in DNA uptake